MKRKMQLRNDIAAMEKDLQQILKRENANEKSEFQRQDMIFMLKGKKTGTMSMFDEKLVQLKKLRSELLILE